MTDLTPIGRNIDKIRIQRGWTKQLLAEKIGNNLPTVSKHIKTGRMMLEQFVRYTDALGCTAGDLADDATDLKRFHLETDILSYYPYNLAVAVMFPRYNPENEEEMASVKDMVHAVYAPALLKEVEKLKDREQKIIQMRYDNGMSLGAVAKEFNVTRERIRQIEAKAIRRLRRPESLRNWRLDTMHAVSDVTRERDTLLRENAMLRTQLDALKTQMNAPDAPMQKAGPTYSEIMKWNISKLKLSVRSENCLRRGGYNTVGDIANTTVDNLVILRNLGRRSLNEILEALRGYGIEIPQEMKTE